MSEQGENAEMRERLEAAIALDSAQVHGRRAEFTADAVLERYAAGRLANTGSGFAALAAEVLRLRDGAASQALSVVDRYLSHYPADLFPEGGESVDAKSAAFARRLLSGLRGDLVATLRGDADTTPAVTGDGGAR